MTATDGRIDLAQPAAPTGAAGPAAAPDGVPLVEMRNIRVAFGGVHAVEDVSIDLHRG